jgi:hypothetical protein
MGMKDKGKKLRGEYAHHWLVGLVLSFLALAISLTTRDYHKKLSRNKCRSELDVALFRRICRVASRQGWSRDRSKYSTIR